MANIRNHLSKLGAVSCGAAFLFAAAMWLNCSPAPDSCGKDYEVFDSKYQKCVDGEVKPIAPEYTVKVVSDGTGATGGGEYPPYAAVTVTAGTPPSGYRFEKWTSSVAVIFVPNANSPTVMFSMPSKSVTVTAAFEKIPAAVKYKVEVVSDGTDATGDGEYAPNDTVTVTAGTPPEGYQFEKWISADGVTFVPSANNETVKFSMPAKDVTVMALYEEIPATASAYIITFDAGAGGIVTPPSRVTDTTGRLAALPVPTKRGYAFDGWFTTKDTSDTSGTKVMPGDTGTVFASDTVIYARWTITTYTITYDSLTGAVVTPANPTSYTVDTATFTLNNPTKTGQKFVGWTEAGDTTMTMDTAVTIAKGSIGDKKYTANWLPAAGPVIPKYAVTVSGGGTGASGGGSYSEKDTVRITAGTPPAGKKFKNWTSADTAVKFNKADTAATWFIMPAKPVTVTANFETTTGSDTTKYKVTVISTGTGASKDSSYNAKDTVKIKAGTPPEGMTFKNWTSADTVTFSEADSVETWFIMPAKPVTVRANFIGDSLSYKGKKYPTVVIGGKIWMAANMNYDTANGAGSWCYGDSVGGCNKYGRLYDWNTAKAVCQTAPGWHLPDTADWNLLVTAAGGETAGKKLKSKTGWGSGNGTDDFGFSALSGGFRDDDDFYSAGEYGYWWTATAGGSDNAYFRSMYSGGDEVDESDHAGKGYGYSVRCVKDDPSPAAPLLSKAKRR